MKKKILSFLLSAAMLFTAQGVPVLAEGADDGGSENFVGGV